MSEYLFPVPGSTLRNLLDFKAKSGTEFSEKEAIADIMLALDRNSVKPERYLAKRWSWSPSKVHRWKSNLIESALGWRSFNHNNPPVEVKQSEARAKQSEAQIEENSTKKGASEARAKQSEARAKQYRTDTYSDTDIKNLSNNKPSAPSKTVKIFSRDSWQYKFSLSHLSALKRLGVAPTGALGDEEKTIQAGADIFDKLSRIDGHSQDEIKRVMLWLLTPSNWWIENGNYASVRKLRKSNDEGVKYFEVFQIQSRKADGKSSKPGTGNSSYTPLSAYHRISAIASAAVDTEQEPVARTGTGG